MTWLWVGLLAVGISAGLVWPLLRRPAASSVAATGDGALYEAQLVQIDADVVSWFEFTFFSSFAIEIHDRCWQHR